MTGERLHQLACVLTAQILAVLSKIPIMPVMTSSLFANASTANHSCCMTGERLQHLACAHCPDLRDGVKYLNDASDDVLAYSKRCRPLGAAAL